MQEALNAYTYNVLNILMTAYITMLGFTADHSLIITVIKMIIIIVIVMRIIITIKIVLLVTAEYTLYYLLFPYLNDYPIKHLLFVVLLAEGYTERKFSTAFARIG